MRKAFKKCIVACAAMCTIISATVFSVSATSYWNYNTNKETGIKMLMTNPKGAMSFSTNANILIRDIKKGYFPKDIKYVVIGHGEGTILNDTWHVAYDPEVKIFDFIEKNIPKGEMVLVNCCETTPKGLKHLIPKNKPAIGKVAGEFTSSYRNPAKVVISGTRDIVGGYANGFLTLYK